jgi:hypothetical protein
MNKLAYAKLIKKLAFESSFIQSYQYNNGYLIVNMKNGTSYTYKGVPQEVFNEFEAAGSKGQFFNEKIKPVYALAPF